MASKKSKATEVSPKQVEEGAMGYNTRPHTTKIDESSKRKRNTEDEDNSSKKETSSPEIKKHLRQFVSNRMAEKQVADKQHQEVKRCVKQFVSTRLAKKLQNYRNDEVPGPSSSTGYNTRPHTTEIDEDSKKKMNKKTSSTKK